MFVELCTKLQSPLFKFSRLKPNNKMDSDTYKHWNKDDVRIMR